MASATVILSSKDVGHVGKFDGTNFPFWKFQVSLVFEQYGLLPVVFGEDVKPSLIQVTDDNGAVSDNQAEIKSWCQRDNAARNGIVASIEVGKSRALINCKTASEMWKRLCSQYEQAAEENKHLLITHFYDLEYDKEQSVIEFVTAVETLKRQLEDIGAPLTDIQVVTKILHSLPPSFRPVVSSWKNLDESQKTLEKLRLIEEGDNKRYADEGTRKANAAFFSNRNQARAP